MDKSISAVEANRHFSRVLRSVREGESFVVTAHGTPVARIVPVAAEQAERRAAFDRLIARLKSQPAMDIVPWTREELYDE